MKFSVIGTSSSTLSTDSLSIHTARLSASTTVIHSGPVTVQLPPHVVSRQSVPNVGNGASASRAADDTDVNDCYEATIMLAKDSPYIYGLADAGQVRYWIAIVKEFS